MKKFLLILSFLFYTAHIFALNLIKPIDYGILNAKSGVERYSILLRCHQVALTNGYGVSYQGIDSVELEIPLNPVGIPLPEYTDFSGVRIIVTNHSKSTFLFRLTSKLKSITINGNEIEGGDFRNNKILANGLNLLVLEDLNPWVSDRLGYGEKAIRRDLLVVKDGMSNNQTVKPYNTISTNLKARYCKTSNTKKVIKNLFFERTQDSDYKTYLIKVENQYNVKIENVEVYTPEDELKSADAVILMLNSALVEIDNLRINGTYSQKKKNGYGLNLDNIYDLTVNKMYARSKWGIFGTNNLNKVKLTDCDINRFDIHCYGKDVKAVNCKFSGLYNQFSSVYGEVTFEKCTFENEIPVLIESSYNAYTPFELRFEKCTFYLDGKKNYLMTLFGVPEAYNDRPELRRKSLPNITVKNCKVVLAGDVEKWYLIHTGKMKYKGNFDYISNVTMKNVKVEGNKEAVFVLSTEELRTTLPLNSSINIR